MNNIAELKLAYPLITAERLHYDIQEYQRTSNKILKPTMNMIEETEIAYLTELEGFVTNTYTNTIKSIKNKFRMIDNQKKFDISKVENLPDDMIMEIKSYLEPELKFTRRFSVIRNIHNGLRWRSNAYTWLDNVPKKLLINLLHNCSIYPSILTTKDKKEEWCNFIYDDLNIYFNIDKYRTRIDKLIEQHTHIYAKEWLVDRWFKIVLYIYVFQKYRTELESKIKKTDKKLKDFKNTKIVVRKNI